MQRAALPAACTGMRQKPPLNAVSRADHADTADDGESRLLCQLHSNLWQVDLLLPAQYASSIPCPGSDTSYAGSGFSRQEALLPAGIAAEASHIYACLAPEAAPCCCSS